MAEINSLYESSLGMYPQLSLRCFCQLTEVKYHCLRDYRQGLAIQAQKELEKAQQIE